MLDWLTEETWTQGCHATNKYDESKVGDGEYDMLSPNSTEAASFDLYGALRVSIYDDSEFYEAIKELKKVYKVLYPEKYASLENRRYFKKDGQIVMLDPALFELNDALESFQQVKRLLFYAN